MKESDIISLDKNKKELKKRGTSLFPCEFYHRSMQEHLTGDIPPHWHRELEILFLDENKVSLALVDRTVELKAGEGYFINSNVLHGVLSHSNDPCSYRSVVFDPIIVSGTPGSVFDMLYIRPFIQEGAPSYILSPNALVSQQFDIAYQANEEKPNGYEFLIREAFSKILLELQGRPQSMAGRPPAQQELRMKQMLSWLDENYSEPITVSQLADTVGISVRECQRSFINIVHCSPMQYLIHRRVAAAARLLTDSDLPIIEIGNQCGFESQSYFTKQFKAITGTTPREYRQQDHAEQPTHISCSHNSQ